jgi:hypothetical protein
MNETKVEPPIEEKDWGTILCMRWSATEKQFLQRLWTSGNTPISTAEVLGNDYEGNICGSVSRVLGVARLPFELRFVATNPEVPKSRREIKMYRKAPI